MNRMLAIILIGVVLAFAVTVRAYDEEVDNIQRNHEMELKGLRNHYNSQTVILARNVAAAQVRKGKATYFQKGTVRSKVESMYGYPVCSVGPMPIMSDYISVEETFIHAYNEFLKNAPAVKKEK